MRCKNCWHEEYDHDVLGQDADGACLISIESYSGGV